LGVSAERSSPKRRIHDGTVEAEGLTGARPEEQWVAPVVGLESTGASQRSSRTCRWHWMVASGGCPRWGARWCMTQRETGVKGVTCGRWRLCVGSGRCGAVRRQGPHDVDCGVGGRTELPGDGKAHMMDGAVAVARFGYGLTAGDRLRRSSTRRRIMGA
jgi:hypothetical protein